MADTKQPAEQPDVTLEEDDAFEEFASEGDRKAVLCNMLHATVPVVSG